MLTINHKECEALGLDPEKVAKLARRLIKCAKEAESLGLEIFGGTGGDLRQHRSENPIVAAHLGLGFSGGAGYTKRGADGLLRGE